MPLKSPSTALPANIWKIPELAAPLETSAKYFFGSTPSLAQAVSASAISALVAGADLADVENVFAERLQHRFDFPEGRFVCSDHRVQPALFRFHRRTGQRRIQEAHAFCVEVCRDLQRRAGLTGRGIHHDLAGGGALENPAFPIDEVLDLR